MRLYQQIARMVGAYQRCKKAPPESMLSGRASVHYGDIQALVAVKMPSGSGWDNATHLDLDLSSGEKLVFTGAYHHMDEHGSYAGWTEHRITVTPSLAYGFLLSISGPNRNEIKDYLADLFADALFQECA